MNPNGRVPTVEENGIVMWESNSIVRYLCTTRLATWFPPIPASALMPSAGWIGSLPISAAR